MSHPTPPAEPEFDGAPEAGDGEDVDKAALLTQLYNQLRAMARRQVEGQPAGLTLQATDIVNLAAVKIWNSDHKCNDEDHFLRVASIAMRQVLVDHAKAKQAAKRRGKRVDVELDKIAASYGERVGGDLLALEASLEQLEKRDPQLVQLVQLRFFAQQPMTTCARVMGLSERHARRQMAAAKAWLRRDMGLDAKPGNEDAADDEASAGDQATGVA